jgi:hypothetical protein
MFGVIPYTIDDYFDFENYKPKKNPNAIERDRELDNKKQIKKDKKTKKKVY